MTQETKVIHIALNGQYRIVFEQAASTKGVLGFKIEVNSDDIQLAEVDADELLEYAQAKAPAQSTEVK